MPLLLDLAGRRVTVFGGGRVALQKARLFAPRARVRVVSESFLPGFDDLEVERVEARVEDPTAYLEDAFLVVPATDDAALNGRIVEAARERGCLVDAVEGDGDVMVPAVVRRGDLLLAISTSGRAPGVARHLRRRLEHVVGPAWEAIVALQDRLREALKATVPDQRDRAARLRRTLEDDGVWEALEAGDRDGAWRRAQALVQEGSDPSKFK